MMNEAIGAISPNVTYEQFVGQKLCKCDSSTKITARAVLP